MEIGIWGDSITYGACDSEGLGWVGRLRKTFPVADYDGVYNRGVCGDTVRDILKRFPAEAESIQPTIILFAFGLNDSKYLQGKNENNVPLGEFRQKTDELVTLAMKYTKKIYILGGTKVDPAMENSTEHRFVNTEVEKYNAVLLDVAKAHQLQFVDLFGTLDTTIDLFDDGLHPNANGYQKLFTKIFSSIKDQF